MTTYVLPTGGRDDFLLLGGGNKDHVTELNGGGGGGGPRISELEGKGALITSAGRAVFPPLFFSSRNKNLSEKTPKTKTQKATSTYLSYLLPATIVNHARCESFGFHRISFHPSRDSPARALTTNNIPWPSDFSRPFLAPRLLEPLQGTPFKLLRDDSRNHVRDVLTRAPFAEPCYHEEVVPR